MFMPKCEHKTKQNKTRQRDVERTNTLKVKENSAEMELEKYFHRLGHLIESQASTMESRQSREREWRENVAFVWFLPQNDRELLFELAEVSAKHRRRMIKRRTENRNLSRLPQLLYNPHIYRNQIEKFKSKCMRKVEVFNFTPKNQRHFSNQCGSVHVCCILIWIQIQLIRVQLIQMNMKMTLWMHGKCMRNAFGCGL